MNDTTYGLVATHFLQQQNAPHIFLAVEGAQHYMLRKVEIQSILSILGQKCHPIYAILRAYIPALHLFHYVIS